MSDEHAVPDAPSPPAAGVIILPESPEAARRVTVEGWVSRDGHFYGDDEQTARYAGATHRRCRRCGAVISLRPSTVCGPCHEALAIARYNALPRAVWDGTGMVYSDACDVYFEGLDEAEEHLDDCPHARLADLRLVICTPVPARELDEDYWIDDLPEDYEVPEALRAAIDDLNRVVATLPPLSYRPGDVALLLPDEPDRDDPAAC